jgi:hypothetical protein
MSSEILTQLLEELKNRNLVTAEFVESKLLIDKFPDEVIYIPDFISIAGSYVEEKEHSDHDIIIRLDKRDESLEVLLNKILKAENDEHKNHFVYNKSGPHSDNIPLYHLVLKKINPKINKVLEAEGRLSIKEGTEGYGVLQTHERGLTEDQTKFTHDFGWEPVTLNTGQIISLNTIKKANWSGLINKAAKGDSKALANALKDIDREKLSEKQRKIIALIEPVSIHTDIRMVPKGENYFEGGEGFTPGNQFQENKFRTIAEKEDSKTRIVANFKVPRKNDGGDKSEIVKGPINWVINIGKGKPHIAAPGEAGASSEAYGRLFTRDSFKWRAGVQENHFKEFWFEGKVLKGRWIFSFVPTGGFDKTGKVGEQKRVWMIQRSKEQKMKSELFK